MVFEPFKRGRGWEARKHRGNEKGERSLLPFNSLQTISLPYPFQVYACQTG